MKLITALALALGLAAAPTAAAEKPAVVRVTYVASPFNVPSIVMRAKGYLEEAFAEQGIKVESPEITSGASQVQALAAGAVDITSVLGGASAILGRANGVDLRVVAAYSRSPKAFSIMTHANGPRTIEELKGKTVAGPKGTTSNQLLAAGLASKNLKLADVNYINMDMPAARAALLSGRVDAATLAGNNALAVEAAGGRIIATGEGLIEPTSVIAVRGAFLRDYPDLVRTYFAAHRKALEFIKANPQEALRLAAAEQKISIEDAARQLPWYDFSPVMTAADIKNLEADQSFMIEAGMLRKTIDIRADLVHPSAFDVR